MLADHAAQQLLDFNQKLDINLLDNVVNCLYHGVGPQVGNKLYFCYIT
jgi:exportin-1